jgi:hypothetical protein
VRFEVFIEKKIQVFFWVVTACNVIVGYQCFRVKMEAERSSKTLESCCNIMWHHNPEDHNLNTTFGEMY